MMSVAKGVTGICFNRLIDAGLVDPDERVAHYWPEFAQSGKQDLTVRTVLAHTAALPVLTDDPMYPGGLFDLPAYIHALESQPPLTSARGRAGREWVRTC